VATLGTRTLGVHTAMEGRGMAGKRARSSGLGARSMGLQKSTHLQFLWVCRIPSPWSLYWRAHPRKPWVLEVTHKGKVGRPDGEEGGRVA